MTDADKLLLKELDGLTKNTEEIDREQAWRIMLISQTSVLSKVTDLSVRVNAMWPFYQASKWVILLLGAAGIGLAVSIFTGQVTLVFP